MHVVQIGLLIVYAKQYENNVISNSYKIAFTDFRKVFLYLLYFIERVCLTYQYNNNTHANSNNGIGCQKAGHLW